MKEVKTLKEGLFEILAIGLVLFSSGIAFADQWAKSYGGNGDDETVSIQQTSDGGFIVAGSTDSFGAGKKDAWVLKLDGPGNSLWQKTYGGSGDDEAFSIQQTSDGGFIVAGSTDSSGAGNKDVWVLKLDETGNILWQKTYGGSGDDEAFSIQQTSDGGFIVAGSTDSFGAGKKDAWVLKLDAEGNILWQKTYGGSGNDETSSIQEALEGGYIMAGSTDSFGAGKSDVWVLKLDADGNVLWQNTFGGSGDDEAFSIQQTSGGGYIVAGSTNSFGAGKRDAWVLNLNTLGNILWERAYGGSNDDWAESIQQISGGGYVLVGTSFSFGAGNRETWLLNLNASGSIVGQKTYGGTKANWAASVQQTSDGGYIVAGGIDPSGLGKQEAWLLKLDSSANINACPLIQTSNATTRSTSISGIASTTTVQDTHITPQATNVSAPDTSATPGVLCLFQGANIAVDPTSIDFGSVNMGSSSSETITISNTGSIGLIINGITITGTNHLEFGLQIDTCSGHTLGTSSTCTVRVIFSPTSSGKKSANLIISSNDPDRGTMNITLSAIGTALITPTSPEDHASFSACSLYALPTFSWNALESFKSYQIQFSSNQTFRSILVSVNVKTSITKTTFSSMTWKKILQIPGSSGGPVFWRVVGTRTDRTTFNSSSFSMMIEPAQPVINPELSTTSRTASPTLSWGNNCGKKFIVYFGNDDTFSKKVSLSFTVKNPNENEGQFAGTVTSRQSDSIRKLVGDTVGKTLYWKVQSSDGLNRSALTGVMNFVITE